MNHSVRPLFVIFDSDSEKQGFFAFPPAFAQEILNTESGRDRFKSLLHRILSDQSFHKHLIKRGRQKPQMVVQIVEAWVSKNVKPEDSNGFKPSEDPNKPVRNFVFEA